MAFPKVRQNLWATKILLLFFSYNCHINKQYHIHQQGIDDCWDGISPLLKMKGDEAMAMAWAAFCIPTSITMVRRAASVKCPAQERSELHRKPVDLHYLFHHYSHSIIRMILSHYSHLPMRRSINR